MVSLNGMGRREGAIIALIALGYWGTVSGIPLPNTGEWRSYFKGRDFKDRTVPPLIKKLKGVEPYDKSGVQHSAEFLKEIAVTTPKGASLLPYAAKLSGVRRLRFFVTLPHFGIAPFYVVRPYRTHAAMLVGGISDPEALPALMRLSFHPDLGRAALSAFNRISASLPAGAPVPRLPKEDVYKLIVNAAHWQRPFSIEPAELRFMTAMDEKEAISLFNQIVANGRATGPTPISTGENYYWRLDDYSQNDLNNFSRFLDAVVRLGDPGSIWVINRQAYGLFRDLRRSQRDSTARVSPETMDKMERLLRMYRRCLSQLSRKEGGRPLIWPLEYPGVPGGPMPEFRLISFTMMSISPDVAITVAPYKKSGIIDMNGVTWTNHKIRLKPGNEFPYEQVVEIRKRPAGSLPESFEVGATTLSGGSVLATVWGN